MTYRERREARAGRLREWAAKREQRDGAVLEQLHERYSGDTAFNTQPGHIPLRARVIAQEDRAWASLRKASDMTARADGIEAQAAGAIYSDDPDAVARLRERIAGLEAERDRIKAYNASCRKGAPDVSLLTDAEREALILALRFAPIQGKGGGFPSYHLTNLSGNIARQRQRLALLERTQGGAS